MIMKCFLKIALLAFVLGVLLKTPPVDAADKSSSSASAAPLDVLFSPNGGIGTKLADLIFNAQSSIAIAAYNIYLPDVSNSLAGARTRGVKIRIIMDNDAKGLRQTDVGMYQNNKIPVYLWTQGLMRDSYMIVDEKTLAAGPFEWTVEGDTSNSGSMLFTQNPEAVKAYLTQFNKLWSD